MANINVQIKNKPNSKGLCPLRLAIVHNGKRKYEYIKGVRVHPDQWNGEAGRVKTNHSEHVKINRGIELRIATLMADYKAKELLHGGLDLDQIAGQKVTKTPFKIYAGKLLDSWEGSKRASTLRGLRSKFALVVKYAPALFVEDITADWLTAYATESKKTCTAGGVLKRMAFVKIIVLQAMRDGLITKNPFGAYKMPKYKAGDRVWLSWPEVQAFERALERYAKSVDASKGAGLLNTGYWFLFSCYTGMRYSDVEQFDIKKHVQLGRIIVTTVKTEDIVSIKLNKDRERLMCAALSFGKVHANQTCNEYLKMIATLAKIDKHITFHSARHSFAIQCANQGMSIEATSKALGHSSIKETAIYYKIINPKLDEELEKWDAPAPAKVVNISKRKSKAS